VREALNADFIATTQLREAQLANGLLDLSASDGVPGSQVARRHLLRWRRPSRLIPKTTKPLTGLCAQ
jgi:hypothetical protein